MPGPSSAVAALALRSCRCPKLLTSQPDGIWSVEGLSSFPGSRWRIISAASQSTGDCMGQQGGHCFSQGRDDPSPHTLPLQSFQPTQGRAHRGLQLTQPGCWHRSPLSQGKNCTYTGTRKKLKQRYRTSGLFPLALPAGHSNQQLLIPERSLLRRYLQRHLQQSAGRHLNGWKINLWNGISYSLEHSKNVSCSFQHLNIHQCRKRHWHMV